MPEAGTGLAAWRRDCFPLHRFLDLQSWKGPQIYVVLLLHFTDEEAEAQSHLSSLVRSVDQN